MAQYFTTSIATGQWFYTTDATPVGAITAPRGSVALRFDAGNVGAWINTNGITDWSAFLVVTSAGVLNLASVSQIVLADNSATALQIGSTGALNLLVFDTVNGAEQVEYNGVLPFLINSGGLNVLTGTVTLPTSSLNVALAAAPISSGVVGASLELRVSYPAGVGPTDIVLPARGLRVTDARLVSGGAGGTVQVQTGGAAVVTDAMVPGAAGAITRAASILNQTFASGATIRIAGAAGTVAGNVYVTFEPV